MLLLLLLDLHIAQHIIPNSTVAPTQHVFPKHSFFKIFKNIIFQTFIWDLSRFPWGFCPSFSNSPTPAAYPQIFSDVSTFLFASFFTVMPNGLTQTSYVLLTLYPGNAQPVGPTHTWPTTRPTTLLEAVEPNLHRHPYATTLLLL